MTGAAVRNVKTGATSEVAAGGIFMAIGHVPNTAVFKGQLEMDENGYLLTDGRHHRHQRARRLRGGRRGRPPLPPGGHRGRHRLHGRHRRGAVPELIEDPLPRPAAVLRGAGDAAGRAGHGAGPGRAGPRGRPPDVPAGRATVDVPGAAATGAAFACPWGASRPAPPWPSWSSTCRSCSRRSGGMATGPLRRGPRGGGGRPPRRAVRAPPAACPWWPTSTPRSPTSSATPASRRRGPLLWLAGALERPRAAHARPRWSRSARA